MPTNAFYLWINVDLSSHFSNAKFMPIFPKAKDYYSMQK
jgi:hypothetical protein